MAEQFAEHFGGVRCTTRGVDSFGWASFSAGRGVVGGAGTDAAKGHAWGGRVLGNGFADGPNRLVSQLATVAAWVGAEAALWDYDAQRPRYTVWAFRSDPAKSRAWIPDSSGRSW